MNFHLFMKVLKSVKDHEYKSQLIEILKWQGIFNGTIRTELCVGKQLKSIVKEEKVLMPPWHIKLGMMNQFVKKMDKKSEAVKKVKAGFCSSTNQEKFC